MADEEQLDKILPDATNDAAAGDHATGAEAMAVYSTDGQADDETGNDAAAEALRLRTGPPDPAETDAMPHGPA